MSGDWEPETRHDAEYPPVEWEPSEGAFGKYELRGLLGEGGMGRVYRAWQPELEREVALKVLAGEMLDEEGVARFLGEARAAARLRHPNIVSVYDVGCHEGRHYFTMELVEGVELWDLIDEGPLPVRRALEIVRDVARGLQHAHDAGLIHRDVKPENILIEEPGGRCLVTDFGLVKQLEGTDRNLTCTGAIMGTPAFMSPQQARAQPLDHRTDVYSLGAVLYMALTGEQPFDAEDPLAIVLQVVERDPMAPRERRPDLHADVETICLKAMAKQPEMRYASVAELADDIERFLEGQPILARPPSLPDRLRRALARRKLAVALVAGTLVALGAATAAVLRMRREVARTRAHSDDRLRAAEQARVRRERELAPLADRIKSVQPLLYLREVDIQAKLRGLRAAVDRLTELGADPATAAHPEIWRLIGIGRYQLRDLGGARSAFERVLSLRSDDPWAHLYLGRIHLERWQLGHVLWRDREQGRALLPRQLARSARHLSRATDRWVGARPIDRHLLRLYQALARGDARAVQQLFHEGLRRFSGEPGREEYWMVRATTEPLARRPAVYEKVLEICPHHALARLLRGTILGVLGKPGASLEDLNRAIALGCRPAEAYFARGNARRALGQLEPAVRDYGEALRRQPELVPALVNRADALARLGRLRAALADLDRALRLDPRCVPATVQRALLYERLRRPTAALADYVRLASLDPGAAVAHHGQGNVLLAQGQLERAIAAYTRAIRLDARHAGAHLNRGICHMRRREYRMARADFDRAIALSPRDPGYRCNSGQLWVVMKRPDLALRAFSEAIRLDPRRVDALVNRAALYYEQKKWALAIRDYELALERAPADWPHRQRVTAFLAQLKNRK